MTKWVDARKCYLILYLWSLHGMQQASLSLTISQRLPKFMCIELTPSNHHIPCCPLILPSVFPSTRFSSNESTLCMRWPKYWSFSFRISPSNEYSKLVSFSIDWFDLLAKGLSRAFSSTRVWRHHFLDSLPSLWCSSHICKLLLQRP